MPKPKVAISDSSGNEVGVTTNALDVNIAGGTGIDIGDVDIHLSGNVPLLGGAGEVAAGVLRITIADDDYHFGEKGTAADHDGTIHGQLRYIGDQVKLAYDELVAIDADTNVLLLTAHSDDAAHINADIGTMSLAVRNDTLASLVSDDGDYAPFQVNASGALYVTGEVTGESRQNIAVTDYGFGIMGEAKTIDGSTLPNLVGEGSAARLAMSRAGIAFTCLTDDAGASDLGTTITTHLSEIEGAVETIEGAIDTQMQVDVVAALPPGSNTIGVVDLGSTDNGVLDAIAASLVTIDSDTDAIKTAVEILDNAISGSEMQVDVVAALPAGNNNIGNVDIASSVALTVDCNSSDVTVDNFPTWFTASVGAIGSPFHYVTEDVSATDYGIPALAECSTVLSTPSGVTNGEFTRLQVDIEGALYTTHGMTGMQSDNNEGVDDTTAEVLKSSTVCKRVDMQADPSNTGYIYVGGSDVSATKGIRLAPGDFYSIDVNNTADIYVLASVDEEDIHFTYFT
jgi:hypothetical protein